MYVYMYIYSYVTHFIYPCDLFKTYLPPSQFFDVDVVCALVGGAALTKSLDGSRSRLTPGAAIMSVSSCYCSVCVLPLMFFFLFGFVGASNVDHFSLTASRALCVMIGFLAKYLMKASKRQLSE